MTSGFPLRLLAPCAAAMTIGACATSAGLTTYGMASHGGEMTSEQAVDVVAQRAAAKEAPFDKPLKVLHAELPKYPSRELHDRVDGDVMVFYEVDESGKVADARIEYSTNEDFSKVSLQAIRAWRFESLTRNGVPVKGYFRQRFPFSIGAPIAR